MGTDRNFQAMLNEYLSIDLMRDELIKRDYLLQKVDRDDGWKSGTIPLPFEGQHATSVSFGSLEDAADVSTHKYVRGQLTTYREVWGTMRFEHRDLMEHDGKVNEKSFLKILPGQVDDFLTYMKMAMSINLMDGPSFAKLTVDGNASGEVEVDRIDRLSIDQKVVLLDGDSAAADYFVISIDVNGGTLENGVAVLSATKGGAAADVSAYTVAQGAALHHPGADTESFTSLASQLLSNANGGSLDLYGQTKTDYPYLQAIQYDGSAISSTNLMENLFDAYTKRQQLAKSGKLPEFVMSFKHFGTAIKQLELSKGAFNVVPESRKASQYGWQEIMIGSVSGELIKLVGIQEKADDNIMCLDWDSITLFTNGFLQRRRAPDGLEYFPIRSTSGFSYILDHVCAGDIVVKAPAKNLIIHSIPNY